MTTQVPCPRCRHPLLVRDAYLGGVVRCPDCRHEFTPIPPRPASSPSMPHAIRKPPRKKPVFSDAVTTRPTIRMSAPKPLRAAPFDSRPIRPHSPLPVLLLLGGCGMLTLVLVAFLGVVSWKTCTGNFPDPNPPEAIENEHPEPVVEAEVPPARPPMPVRLTPDEIYRRTLKSTVYVVAKSPAPPGTPEPPSPVPPQPKMPIRPLPKTPPKTPPKAAEIAKDLLKSVWMGTEDLPGFGKLRFDFCTPNDVVVRDAKDSASGKWTTSAPSTVRIQLPSAEYVGQVNGDTIVGTAKSKQGGITWKFAVNRKYNATPMPLPRYVTRTGTGVLVDAERRLVVTNLHVVGEAEFVEIAFPKYDEDGEPELDPKRYQSGRIRGQVVHKEPLLDLVLVRLDQLPANVEPMPIAPERTKADEVVHLVGNPGEKKEMWVYRPSKVRAVGEERWEVPDPETKKPTRYEGWRIEIEGPISPGDSGGPLVNEKGELVGVAHAGDVSGNRVSYYIDASEVRAAIGRYRERIGDPEPKGE